MKKVTLFFAMMLAGAATFAQDAPVSKPLEITGSGDLYYKYDFAKASNISTSFATDQNSLSLGMLDIAVKKTTGKASFVGELSYGPRGAGQSIPDTEGQSFHLQNLYASYAFTDKFSMTAGYMGTFVGYEVISPVGNFNYSTSYMFTNGPFQNAGVKANYKISDKFGAMVGLFNDKWNAYTATDNKGLNAVGAQVSYTAGKVSAYLNFIDGSVSGTILDLTATIQVSDKFKLGINAADFDHGTDLNYSYQGAALYPIFSLTNNFSLGLRAEYFKKKTANDNLMFAKTTAVKLSSTSSDEVTAFTLTGNYKAGGLTFIPEFRLDSNANKSMGFQKSNGDADSLASQAVLAVVYAF